MGFDARARDAWASPRAVRLLLGSAAVTYVGDEIAAIALALAVHGAGASSLVVAALFAAKMLPSVLLAPWSGAVVDRLGADRALMASSAAASLVVAATALTDSVPLWLLGTALMAATATVAQPALLTLLPRAAGPDAARRAMSWAAVASRSSAATGALLAGALVSVGGLRLALLVDAATYLVVVLGVRHAARRLPAAAPRSDAAEADRSVLAGFRLVGTDPVLRVVLSVLLSAVVFVGISYVAVFFFVSDVLGGGPRATTAVVAAYGVGMTVGCWLAGRVPSRVLAQTAVRAPVLTGLGFLAPVLVPALPVAVVGFLLAGLAAGTAFTSLRGLVLERVPEHLLGRVYAAEGALGTGAELLSLAVAGALVALAGPVAAMAVCGAGTLLAGAAGWAALRSGALRRATAAAVDPVARSLPAPRRAADDLVPQSSSGS